MITTNANGQYFLMNPPELIIGNVTMRNQLFKIFLDDPFYAGCFNITDVSLLGSPTAIDNIPGKFYCSIFILKRFIISGCAVQCKSGQKRISALKDSDCYCLDEMPYTSLFYSDDCTRFYVAGEEKIMKLLQKKYFGY